MAKATVVAKSGSTVTIEGTEAEVANLLRILENTDGDIADHRSPQRQRKTKTSIADLVSELIVGGFFAKPKELGAVKRALAEQGHFYPVTTLSPLMLRLVRKKELRRIKDKSRWTYVG